MRHAYALLGLLFIIVFVGAYILMDKAYSPTEEVLKKITTIPITMKLLSSAFEHNGMIPPKYTCDGENINPPLDFSGLPEGTESLVLVMDDSDIPVEIKEKMGIKKFNHWAEYNIPTLIEGVLFPENYYNSTDTEFEMIGTTGKNTKGETTYTGPCPPAKLKPKTHRYSFRLYALSGKLSFTETPTIEEIEETAQELMLEKTELIGMYSRAIE